MGNVQFRSNVCMGFGVGFVRVFLVGFVFSSLKKEKEKKHTKKPNNNNNNPQPHTSELMEVPCKVTLASIGHRDAQMQINNPDVGSTRRLPVSNRTPAEVSDTNISSF